MKKCDVFIKVASGTGNHGTDHLLVHSNIIPSAAKKLAKQLSLEGHRALVLTHGNVGKFVAAYAPK